MKYLLIAVFSTFLVVSPTFSKADDLNAVISSLCDYAKNNNRTSMRKKLKQARLKLRKIYQGVQCGAGDGFEGGSLLRVSTYFGAYESAKFIATKIGAKGISNAENDGKNILTWTEALQNSGSASTDLVKFIQLFKSKS
jgi:hypothetical protein